MECIDCNTHKKAIAERAVACIVGFKNETTSFSTWKFNVSSYGKALTHLYLTLQNNKKNLCAGNVFMHLPVNYWVRLPHSPQPIRSSNFEQCRKFIATVATFSYNTMCLPITLELIESALIHLNLFISRQIITKSVRIVYARCEIFIYIYIYFLIAFKCKNWRNCVLTSLGGQRWWWTIVIPVVSVIDVIAWFFYIKNVPFEKNRNAKAIIMTIVN